MHPIPDTNARQIEGFLAPYDPVIRRLALDARARLRRLMPTAVEQVYDNYNALVFGFGSTEKASDAFVSLALYPHWVRLFFLQGASLPDPASMLSGSGKQVRSIQLSTAADLDQPEIVALLAEAISRSAPPLPAEGPGKTMVKSISAKQRPRS